VGALHTLVTSGLVGAAGSARAGVGVAELALRRAPSLVALGARATVATGAGASRAQAVFRDDLLTLFDDAAEIAWREARRARIELGERTSPPDVAAAGWEREPAAPAAAAAANAAPHRRHRVKA
jgi:hypothetical protein